MSMLILGDSWSDPNYLKQTNSKFVYWTERFDAVNLSKTACSNDYIFDAFLRHHSSYDKIVILWSTWTRYGMGVMLGRNTNTAFACRTLNYMTAVSHIRPDAFQMQGPDPIEVKTEFDEWEDNTGEYSRMRREALDIAIRYDPIGYGFPFFSEIGGFSMKDKLQKLHGNDYRMAWNDAHPNELGHNTMYEYIQSCLE